MKRSLKKMSDPSDVYNAGTATTGPYHSQYQNNQAHYSNLVEQVCNPNIHLHHHHHVIAPILASASGSQQASEANGASQQTAASQNDFNYQNENAVYQSGSDGITGAAASSSPIVSTTLPASCGSTSSSSSSSSSSNMTPYLSSTHPSPNSTSTALNGKPTFVFYFLGSILTWIIFEFSSLFH